MSKEFDFLKKQRYKYYNGSTSIIDNEVDELVEDVCDRLNTQDFNKNELLKVKQRLENRVADLETKLAESEKEKENLKAQIILIRNNVSQGSIKDLENLRILEEEKECFRQRLAEKTGELYQIYSHLGVEAFGEDIHEQALKEIANRENQYNQLIFKSKYTSEEMIDFAVEQLKFLRNEIEIMGHIPNYTVFPERELICRYDVFRFIDQQIKELKGEK